MAVKKEFKVTVTKNEVVVGALPKQDHWLPLSNIDLMFPPMDLSVFFCYKKPSIASNCWTFHSMVSVLKKSLAETLVSYYAFAGEMVQNLAGEAELLCNNHGVQFTEAFADIELQELDLYNPDQSVEGKLVPEKKHGVFAVQATELKCGGLVVGCTFDHRIADAYSVNMFLVSWSETAQMTPLSVRPSFRRSLLSPRRPGHYDASVDNTYMLMPKPPLPNDHSHSGAPLTKKVPNSRIYHVSAHQVLQLQSWANTGKSVSDIKRTKVEAVTAFLWKMVAKDFEKGSTRLGIIVDGRTRLSEGDENREKLMGTYFGNVLSVPFGEIPVSELKDMPLHSIANEVHKFIQIAATKEHFMGVIDYVEAHRPELVINRVLFPDLNMDDQTLVVSSNMRFPVRKMDFGWGKPGFGSYHRSKTLGEGSFCMPMPSASGNGDWILYITLPGEQIEALEENASHVFTPVSSDFI